MVKPNFIIIGAQKAGTNSLFNVLTNHPDIFIKGGETHLFDKPKNQHFDHSTISNYEKSFKTNKTCVGEKTPSYYYLLFAIDRIHHYYPDIKIILILREPISRAFSQFNMNSKTVNKSLKNLNDQEIIHEFEKEQHVQLRDIQKNGAYYITRGYYDEIIEYLYSKFPKKNIYIGIAEEIKDYKLTNYNNILDFLNVSNIHHIEDSFDTHIGKYNKPISKELEYKLYTIYKPHVDKLYSIIGRKIESWEKYYHSISSSHNLDTS